MACVREPWGPAPWTGSSSLGLPAGRGSLPEVLVVLLGSALGGANVAVPPEARIAQCPKTLCPTGQGQGHSAPSTYSPWRDCLRFWAGKPVGGTTGASLDFMAFTLDRTPPLFGLDLCEAWVFGKLGKLVGRVQLGEEGGLGSQLELDFPVGPGGSGCEGHLKWAYPRPGLPPRGAWPQGGWRSP